MTIKCQYIFIKGSRRGTICNRLCKDGLCNLHQKRKKNIPFTTLINEVQKPITLTIIRSHTLLEQLTDLKTTEQNKQIILEKLQYLDLLEKRMHEYTKNKNWITLALKYPYEIIKFNNANEFTSKEQITDYVDSIWEKLNKNLYGLYKIKELILGFICAKISNPHIGNNNLAFEGGNGLGKTRCAHLIAEILDLPFYTVNLGGMNDVSYLTGHDFTYADSEPGRICKIMIEAGVKNCIIFFDELDKIAMTDKGQAIYSYLIHLLDPTQNNKMHDIYFSGLLFDMSKVLFIFSFNDRNKVDKTLLDRLKIVTFPDLTLKEKKHIAQHFILPELYENLKYQTLISPSIIQEIVYQLDQKRDSSLRRVKHILDHILTQLNMYDMLTLKGQKQLTFYTDSQDREDIIRKIIHDQLYDERNLSYLKMYS